MVPSIYELRNGGLTLGVTDAGASIVGLLAPDREGVLADVVLGFDLAERYLAERWFLGSIVGRCANRIAGGRFELDGRLYAVARNDGEHQLHGGPDGFDRRVWEVEEASETAIVLSLVSPDGDQGYPGALRARVRYALTERAELVTEMEAATDAPTLCNLAQHAYWHLGGHDSGDVLGHEVTVFADAYLPVDSASIPTGEVAPVAGTAFDFREGKAFGRDLGMLHAQGVGGYDHNFVVRGEAGEMRAVARVREPRSGRVMELWSDQAGVQVFSGNNLDGTVAGKGGARYGRHAGLCLETQAWPNAVNVAGWDAPVLRPGEVYRHRMVTRFGVG